MIIRRKKIKKTAKTKCKFHGEKLFGPQASLRVTPCPPAPNHTRGEVIRPPSQIKNNSYSVIRTRDLDDLSSTRCAPTTTARPSGRINCRCEEFFNTGSVGGGEGEEVCLTESEVVRFWSRIKETNRTKN